MQIPQDELRKVSAKYVGTPFELLDCYGLVMEIYAHFGIHIPPYPHHAENELRYKEVQHPQVGDIVLMKTKGAVNVNHVGLYLGNGWMIQSLEKHGVVLSRINQHPFRNWIVGYVRLEGVNIQDDHPEDSQAQVCTG